MRRLMVLLALLPALAAAGCGDDDEPSARGGDARELLQRAFNASMPSGRLAFEADVQLDGPEREDEAYGLKVSGPFVTNGERLPSLDLDISVSGLGPALSGGLVVTDDNAFVSFGGEDYEIGEELVGQFNRRSEEAADGRTTLEDFGIDASRWLRDPEIAGEEEIEGTSTTKVSGAIDAPRVLADIAKLDELYAEGGDFQPLGLDEEERERLGGLVEESRADVYVADDGTLRRLTLDLEFEVPEDVRDDADGIEGGSAKLDLTFSEVGEEQNIEAPQDAKPIDELLGRFGLSQETLQ